MVAAACILLLGLGAFALWFVGTPADGHPLCRRCGFDLVGSPGAAACPECGADLGRPSAVRPNNRRRARWQLLVAVALLIMAAAPSVPGLRTRAAATDWNRHKPVWWLTRDTRSADPSVVGPALRELLSRYEAGKLPDARVAALAAQGLKYRDNNAPCGMWNCEYGNLLDIAWDRNLLTPDQRDRYVSGAMGLWWSGPHFRTFAGAPREPFFFISFPLFVGNEYRSMAAPPPVDFEVRSISATLDGEAAAVDLTHRPGGYVSAGDYRTTLATASVQLPVEHTGSTLELMWEIQIVDLRTRAPVGNPWTGVRRIVLDGAIRGGARPQDERRPPDISRY